MPQRWAATDRLLFGETVFSELSGAKSSRESWVRGLGDGASCCSEAGLASGHEPGGSQSCRGKGCGQGSGLAPGTGSLSCWPVPPTPRQGGGLRVHSWTLPQVSGSLAGPSTQQLPGNDWRPGHESSFAVATQVWAGGGRGVLPPKGPVQESGDLIPPGSGLRSRLGVGELGVRVPLAWSPSGSPAGQSEEGELDSAQLVSQTQLSCSCLEVLSFFPNVPQMLLALSHQQFAVIPRCNHTCPQAVPRCMARPVHGLNIPFIPGVGGAISRFSEVPESPGQWGRKSGWELKREHKAVFVKLGH